jgi:hypothetical protein
MKFKPFENYSKPADMDDEEIKGHLRSALRYFKGQNRHRRIGDLVAYLNDIHSNKEFDPVRAARNMFEMNKEIKWSCEEIDGVLYPVCDLLSDFKPLAIYKKLLLAKT